MNHKPETIGLLLGLRKLRDDNRDFAEAAAAASMNAMLVRVTQPGMVRHSDAVEKTVAAAGGGPPSPAPPHKSSTRHCSE